MAVITRVPASIVLTSFLVLQKLAGVFTVTANAHTRRRVTIRTRTTAPNVKAHMQQPSAPRVTKSPRLAKSSPFVVTTGKETGPSQSKTSNCIITPISVDRLMYWLEGYEDRQFLSSGFTKGFSIQFNGSPFNSFHPNHNSAARQPHLLRNLINKEVKAGRVAGPFSSPPFSPFVVSPLGLVPKKEPNKFRVIHDLSYPHGQSVNFFHFCR
jgi:hypothetical protein